MRRTRAVLVAALLAALAGCGDSSSQAAWVSTHPDTSLLSFQATAPGICAITVQYPNDAPAAIGYLGSVYVQVARRARPGTSAGHQLDHSGDWSIVKLDNGDLLLVTPKDAFDYRLEASC